MGDSVVDDATPATLMVASQDAPPFVGRAAELSRLRKAGDEVRAGRGRIVLVSGEAGIGKSRLLAQFWEGAPDFVVGVGHCLELTPTNRGIGPWLEAIAGIDRACGTTFAGEVAELLDASPRPRSPSRAAESADVGVLFHLSVLQAIRDTACMRPVLVVIEDLQWSDSTTLELLTFLGVNLTDDPVLFAVTITDDFITDARDRRALHTFQRSLLRMPGHETIRLSALADSDVGDLLRAILGHHQPDEQIADLIERSEGSPLFAEQLAHVAEAGGHGIPASLEELFAYRVSRLPRGERTLLETLAIAGQPVSVDLLSAVTGAGLARSFERLDHLVDQNLATADSAGLFTARHALAGAAIYAHLPPHRRRADHLRIAQVLLIPRPGGDVPYWVRAQAAHHLEEAGEIAQARILQEEAAHQANGAAAYLDASRCFEEVIRLSAAGGITPHSARLMDLREAAATSSFAAGEFDAAISHLRNAIEESPGTRTDMIRLRCALGSYLLEAGCDGEAIGELETAIGSMRRRDPSVQRTHALATLAAALMLDGQYKRSRLLCVRVRRRAAALGDSYLESQVLSFLGVDLVNLGDLATGISTLRRAVELAERSARIDGVLESVLNLADMLIRTDRLEEAALLATEAAKRADEAGLTRRVGAALRSVVAEALTRAGRETEAGDVLTLALRSNPRGKGRLLLLITLARGAWLRGELDDATSYLEAAADTETCRSVDSWPHYAEVLCAVELARGNFASAREVAQGTLGMLAATDADHLRAPLLALSARIEAEAAITAQRNRRPTEVEAARIAATRIGAALDRVQLEGDGPAGIRAELVTCRAEVSRAAGRSSPDLWQEAGRLWEESGRPLEHANALMREGEALLQRGARSDARNLLLRSMAAAQEIGASSLEQEIQGTLVRARLRNVKDAQARAISGSSEKAVGGLSRRERQILDLISCKLTNAEIAKRLFVSPATVATHVSHILAKLGVQSRMEAADVVGTSTASDDQGRAR